jgi:GT2 family glycosyltransferase
MAVAASSRPRVCVDGKFFRLGDKKFYVKGLAYGPFAPNAAGQCFAPPEQTRADLAQIRDAGANLVRVYGVPAKWFLDLAAEHALRVLVDIPWNKHLCFLDSRTEQANAREAVRRAVFGCARHPAIFAFSVANEIPPDVVRWSGAQKVADFIDELVHVAKHADPECLCTFSNYPPTEYLRPQSTDFACFNVYLHEPQPFRSYLARLQTLADSKPLLLGEFGMDSQREGEARQAQTLDWQIESAFRAGLAGAVVFSYTDDWWRGGRSIDDWTLGLTTRERKPKPAFAAVQRKFNAAPRFRPSRYPRVSVIVASYNGARTLTSCLDSLLRLNYPDYEVILVDDGSTDATPHLALKHAGIRYFRHEKNLGLSTARNTGIAAATGEIVAFTDADCRADEDWLYYLVADLLDSEFAAIGGPNLLPPEDSAIAAAVMVSPGGPAHVLLTDRQAEHIPGCNMAFYKSVLAQIGGFDPIFHQAGDDVDICWRLQQAGYKIGFSPAAFVWHYRRSSVAAYLKQQYGYGEAEALLVRKHPECFNTLGAGLWHGHIYSPSNVGVFLRPPIIYRGRFGSAGFQSLYAVEPAATLMVSTRPEYYVLVTLPLLVLSVTFHNVLPVAITSLLVSLGVCIIAGLQAAVPSNQARWWSRPLVALLYFLQPLVRGGARYRGRLLVSRGALPPEQTLDSVALRSSHQRLRQVHYWAEQPLDRLAWAGAIVKDLDQQGWPNKADIGWSDYDVEVQDTRWSRVQLATVSETYDGGKQMIRCRLCPRWALRTKVTFWILCAVQLLLCGLFAERWPWLWLMLLTLPLFAWFIRRQQRKLQSMIVILLDELAREWKLTRVIEP